MMSMRHGTVLVLLCGLGCRPTVSETPPDSPPAGMSPAVTTNEPAAQEEAATKETPAPSQPAAVKAAVGVGQQGRSLDKTKGVGRAIAQPARSLFAVRERMVFEVQIPQAMQLFQATEGRGPRSHDEFMTKIIRANNIRLPRLPEGQSYAFDPKAGELMVETKSN